MSYQRYPRGTQPGDYYGRRGDEYDYSGGRSDSYSSARDYAAAGEYDRQGYGGRDDGGRDDRFGQRDRYGRQDQWGQGHDRSDYGARGGYGRGNYGQGRDSYGQGGGSYGGRDDYRGSYASDGRRFEDVGRNRHADDDDHRGSGQYRGQQQRGYGRQPQGYDYEDRGFFARAGDEVRSWFGDDDAERRREMDSRMDDRAYAQRDHDYHGWRQGQIAALDRDYDEYRRENRSKFENEFSSWRSNRQTQRDALGKVEEHMDVVGSDGSHVGTVDKVRGDRILLTKNDADAGGRHHSIPSSWISTVDTKVTLSKSASDAKAAWKDEERAQAMSGYGDRTGNGDDDSDVTRGRTLNRSFSGTY